jgi:integrase
VALFKRGKVYWAYHWVDGVRHAQSTGTGNRRTAETIAQRFKDELNLARVGVADPKPEMTFAELAARFLAEGSPRPYHIDRLKLLLPFWGKTQIGRITKARAREYRTYRHKAKQHLSDTTINRDLEALRHMLFWAVDEGILLANPLSRVLMVRERRKPRLMVTVTEEDNLLAAAAPHLRSIIIAALDSGMRRGEILTQRWEHVDFTRRLLYVTHSKTAGGEAREIPLTDRLFEELERKRQPEGLIFLFQDKPIVKIKTAWKAAIRRAGIRYFRFHDLRHTFNTRLMEAGVMQEVRKALMGHSSGEETNAIYTHVELPVKREALQKLERWVEEERRKKKEEDEKKKEGQTTDEERNNNGGDPEPASPESRSRKQKTARPAHGGSEPPRPERALGSPGSA